MPNKRILLVVDVSNLYYCVGKKYTFEKRLDYEKYFGAVEQEGSIFRAIAYGTDTENKALEFKVALRHIGFETKYVDFVPRYPEEKMRAHDFDVMIAMDVVQILDSVDVVVFGTADADLVPCVEYIKSRGKQAFVFACGISRGLRESCDRYMEINEELLNAISQVHR